MTETRRRFLQRLSRSFGAGALAYAGSHLFPAISASQTPIARVVVVGGGFAGATCANFLMRYGPNLDVTLIEPKQNYTTCPFSNTVFVDDLSLDSLSHSYEGLAQMGCSILHQRAVEIDADLRTVILADGVTVPYDKLVVSPGIALQWDLVEGLDESTTDQVPHAWTSGDQIDVLRNRIEGMESGGVVAVSVPTSPYRAPPAPYERASLIAHYLTQNKPGSKLLLLDPSEQFPMQAVFESAWSDLYGDVIERVNTAELGLLEAVDASTSSLAFSGGETIQADVLNYIPSQRAGDIAVDTGLTDESGWCPIDPRSFESTLIPDIHVIGDAAQAGDMVKTGSAANAQAKVCAANLVAGLQGEELIEPFFGLAFYVHLAPRSAASQIDAYRVREGQIVRESTEDSPADASTRTRRLEAQYAEGWYKSITGEAFGAA